MPETTTTKVNANSAECTKAREAIVELFNKKVAAANKLAVWSKLTYGAKPDGYYVPYPDLATFTISESNRSDRVSAGNKVAKTSPKGDVVYAALNNARFTAAETSSPHLAALCYKSMKDGIGRTKDASGTEYMWDGVPADIVLTPEVQPGDKSVTYLKCAKTPGRLEYENRQMDDQRTIVNAVAPNVIMNCQSCTATANIAAGQNVDVAKLQQFINCTQSISNSSSGGESAGTAGSTPGSPGDTNKDNDETKWLWFGGFALVCVLILMAVMMAGGMMLATMS
jgi:hypothetical protein